MSKPSKVDELELKPPATQLESEAESTGSTEDSSSDSGSSSDDETADPSLDQVGKVNDNGVNEKLDSDNESSASSNTSGSNESTGSFKSLNTTMGTKAVDNTVKISSPTKKELVMEVDESAAPVVAPSQIVSTANAAPNSPIPITPAKTMVLHILPASPSSNKYSKVPPPVVKATPTLDPPSTPVGHDGAIVPRKRPLATPIARVKANSQSEPNSLATPQSGNQPPNDSKSVKKKKKKKSKTANLNDEQRYERKVRKLERALKRAEKGKAKSATPKQRGGKQPKTKSANSKKSKQPETSKHVEPDSSDDDSSSSSSSSSSDEAPEAPPTSSRIARLPPGKRFQNIAMSRSKELGLIKDDEWEVREVVEGLKVIDETNFDIVPTENYAQFHQVPGVGLPHIRLLLRDFFERYGILVRTVAKVRMIAARAGHNAAREAIGPEHNNPFAQVWQFQNDLVRAPAVPDLPPAPVDDNQADYSPAPKKAKLKVEKKAKKAKKTHKNDKESSPAPAKEVKSKSTKSQRSTKKKKKNKGSGSDSEVLVLDYYTIS